MTRDMRKQRLAEQRHARRVQGGVMWPLAVKKPLVPANYNGRQPP